VALPKSNRIVKNIDIQSILHKSFTADSNYFKIKAKINHVGKFRLLVVVSKKIAKKANKRNFLKRRIVYLFEKLKHSNKLPDNLDLMIIIKNKEVLDLQFAKIVDDILPLYKYVLTKAKKS